MAANLEKYLGRPHKVTDRMHWQRIYLWLAEKDGRDKNETLTQDLHVNMTRVARLRAFNAGREMRRLLRTEISHPDVAAIRDRMRGYMNCQISWCRDHSKLLRRE